RYLKIRVISTFSCSEQDSYPSSAIHILYLLHGVQ
ncbi:unnamed protein product, partial [Brassica oleracea]